MIGNNYHISFCTAIRNRLCHLRETLPQNILKNKDYDHLQFVILDYNSSDGLEEWMAQEMAGFIETGKVVYFRTRDPGLFHRTHCMNLLFDLADGISYVISTRTTLRVNNLPVLSMTHSSQARPYSLQLMMIAPGSTMMCWEEYAYGNPISLALAVMMKIWKDMDLKIMI